MPHASIPSTPIFPPDQPTTQPTQPAQPPQPTQPTQRETNSPPVPRSKVQTVSSSPNLPNHLHIGFAPLDLAEVYALADAPENGAVVVMSGMVRNNTDGRSVLCLEYQAYEPMALRVFEQIAQEIRRRWTIVERVVIHHRTGRLQVGEISVLVAIGCPHRGEAFEACRYAIDTLKHHAPIWKKEHWIDGSSSWVSIGACEADESIDPLPTPPFQV